VGSALIRACFLVAILVVAGLVLRPTGPGLLHALHPGVAGAALLVGIGGVMVAAALPRQVLAFAGGYVFGAPAGIALSLCGQMLGCMLDYAAALGLAAGLARRLLARPAGRRVHRLLVAHPFTATLTLRLLPVSSNVMLNVLAGAARLKLSAFLGATLLGYLPQTIVFALLGSGTQVGRGTQLAVGAALFAAASVLGVVLYRRARLQMPPNVL
jgi:uncharacterized membrane protein YdjX (TVP38/TMEM64 family)